MKIWQMRGEDRGWGAAEWKGTPWSYTGLQKAGGFVEGEEMGQLKVINHAVYLFSYQIYRIVKKVLLKLCRTLYTCSRALLYNIKQSLYICLLTMWRESVKPSGFKTSFYLQQTETTSAQSVAPGFLTSVLTHPLQIR